MYIAPCVTSTSEVSGATGSIQPSSSPGSWRARTTSPSQLLSSLERKRNGMAKAPSCACIAADWEIANCSVMFVAYFLKSVLFFDLSDVTTRSISYHVRNPSGLFPLRASSLKGGSILSSFQDILEEEESSTKKEESNYDSHADETRTHSGTRHRR